MVINSDWQWLCAFLGCVRDHLRMEENNLLTSLSRDICSFCCCLLLHLLLLTSRFLNISFSFQLLPMLSLSRDISQLEGKIEKTLCQLKGPRHLETHPWNSSHNFWLTKWASWRLLMRKAWGWTRHLVFRKRSAYWSYDSVQTASPGAACGKALSLSGFSPDISFLGNSCFFHLTLLPFHVLNCFCPSLFSWHIFQWEFQDPNLYCQKYGNY